MSSVTVAQGLCRTMRNQGLLSCCFAGVGDRYCTWIPTRQQHYWYLTKTLHSWPTFCTSLSQGVLCVCIVGFWVAGCWEQLRNHPWTLTPCNGLFHLSSFSKVLSQLVSLLWSGPSTHDNFLQLLKFRFTLILVPQLVKHSLRHCPESRTWISNSSGWSAAWLGK